MIVIQCPFVQNPKIKDYVDCPYLVVDSGVPEMCVEIHDNVNNGDAWCSSMIEKGLNCVFCSEEE